VENPENRLTADDRIAILDVLSRWNLYEDTGQAEAWAGLFTADGVSTSMSGKILAGHDALAENARSRWEEADSRRSVHWMGAVSVSGTPERAFAQHLGVMASRDAADESGFQLRTHAVRRYEFVKEHGEWRILRRTISAVPGPAAED
jgi:hypothetical protein